VKPEFYLCLKCHNVDVDLVGEMNSSTTMLQLERKEISLRAILDKNQARQLGSALLKFADQKESRVE